MPLRREGMPARATASECQARRRSGGRLRQQRGQRLLREERTPLVVRDGLIGHRRASAGQIRLLRPPAWLLRQAGSFAVQGAAEESIQAFLEVENRVRCDPPLEPAEIQRAVASAVSYETYERGLRASAFQKFRREEERRQQFTLIDDEEITHLPAPRWTIDGILPEKSLSLWHAPPGRGKTFTMLDISLSIGAGIPWFGRSVQQGTVIYVAAEGGAAIGQRVRGWKAYHGVEGPVGVYFLPRTLALLEPEAVNAFLDQASQYAPVASVFIDTFGRAMVGGEEESTRDMGRAIAAVDRIRVALDAGVGVIHHPIKKDERIERGSGALKGAVDTVVRFGQDDDEFTLICEKQKDAEPFPKLRGRLEVVPLDDGSTSCVLVHIPGPVAAPRRGASPPVLSEDQQRALAVLATLPQGRSTPRHWAKAADISDRNIYRVRAALEKAGYVEPVPDERGSYRITERGKKQLRGTATAK